MVMQDLYHAQWLGGSILILLLIFRDGQDPVLRCGREGEDEDKE